MNRWLLKIWDWYTLRGQRALKHWARVRVEGRARFVIRMTLSFSVMILMMRDFIDGSIGLFTVISTHLIGILVGLIAWWDGESKYKNALIQGRVNAAPTGEISENPYLALNSD